MNKLLDIKFGATRTVLLLGSFVFKIPTSSCWKLFLLGMVANINERKWSELKHPRLSRVFLSCPLGLFIICERLRPVVNSNLFILDLTELYVTNKEIHRDFWLSDSKQQNFAYRGPILVKIDYGD